jgi:dynactin complex subunit
MLAIQYDLFKTKEESEMDALRLEMAKCKLSCDKVRKKLFSENGALKKEVKELSERLEIIERNICRG